jgi:tetratricopeptide (TPR) repeat protein
MRRLALVVCLCAPGAVAASGRQLRAPASGLQLPVVGTVAEGRLERLAEWLKAVARHAPGEDDAPLQQTAGLANADLKDLWVDANVLVQITRSDAIRSMTGKRAVDRFSVRSEGQKTATTIRYTPRQMHRMTVLACAAGGLLLDPPCMSIDAATDLDADLRQIATLARTARSHGEDNYLVRRAAILHSDVAMLAPQTMNAPGEVSPGGLQRFRMEISDGREIDLHQSAVHWEVARMLLDLVVPKGDTHPAPGRDDMVRAWYRATASWMQLREDHDKLHLDRARALFPGDADILFLSGCQRETYAAPPIQTAVRSAVLPSGVTLDVESERIEWREAEGLFHRALEIKPDFAEARLRHGRVLGALGRHGEAVAELRRALGDLADPQLLYYAELFLGAEEEALGNRDAARVAYEQAAEHFPHAQSPPLALSQLARRYGDRGGALRAIERLFALPADERDPTDDPWWWYFVAQARDADDLIAAMHRPFLAERLP